MSLDMLKKMLSRSYNLPEYQWKDKILSIQKQNR